MPSASRLLCPVANPVRHSRQFQFPSVAGQAVRTLIPALTAAILLACSACVAQWTNVGDGVDYREWVLPDPNRLFVARMARASMSTTLETCLPYARLTGGRETTTAMSARMDDAIGYWNGTWGMRNDVVVAVNGDFFNTTTGVPLGGQIHSGW